MKTNLLPMLIGLVALAAAPMAAYAQDSGTTVTPAGQAPGQTVTPAQSQTSDPNAPAAPQSAALFAQPQLDQLLAPIALYPDQLLAQILMAATYPIEVVDAYRWVSDPNNAGLQGDALKAALDQQNWDPSVKSLVPFPQILKMMNDKLDWTQQLGNAFLAQQADVMNTVQSLRQQAQAAGKLASTPQETVQDTSNGIVIQPAQPDTVYVPVYDPSYAYGPWAYPDYPPYYFPPPPGFVVGGFNGGFGFSIGFGVGGFGPLWGWGGFDWGHRDRGLYVNAAVYDRISPNRPFYAGASGRTAWVHDPYHRGNVAYPLTVRASFGADPHTGVVSRTSAAKLNAVAVTHSIARNPAATTTLKTNTAVHPTTTTTVHPTTTKTVPPTTTTKVQPTTTTTVHPTTTTKVQPTTTTTVHPTTTTKVQPTTTTTVHPTTTTKVQPTTTTVHPTTTTKVQPTTTTTVHPTTTAHPTTTTTTTTAKPVVTSKPAVVTSPKTTTPPPKTTTAPPKDDKKPGQP